uniref:Secreted protein n=1 Tax=Pseudonaja textilis TaxID=8673 RepID=A0A670Y305_PSETE
MKIQLLVSTGILLVALQPCHECRTLSKGAPAAPAASSALQHTALRPRSTYTAPSRPSRSRSLLVLLFESFIEVALNSMSGVVPKVSSFVTSFSFLTRPVPGEIQV